jgi:hypothetical protein
MHPLVSLAALRANGIKMMGWGRDLFVIIVVIFLIKLFFLFLFLFLFLFARTAFD